MLVSEASRQVDDLTPPAGEPDELPRSDRLLMQAHHSVSGHEPMQRADRLVGEAGDGRLEPDAESYLSRVRLGGVERDRLPHV